MVAIAGWVLTSHSPTHGGRCRQPDVHVLSTDYHRGHKDLLNCHWGGDFLDECLTAVLGCLLRYPTPVRTPSRLWLIWPTGTINLVPAKLGSLKWSYPFLPGRGSHKYLEWAGPFYWIWRIRGVVAVPFVRIGGGWGELNGKKEASTTLKGYRQPGHFRSKKIFFVILFTNCLFLLPKVLYTKMTGRVYSFQNCRQNEHA